MIFEYPLRSIKKINVLDHCFWSLFNVSTNWARLQYYFQAQCSKSVVFILKHNLHIQRCCS